MRRRGNSPAVLVNPQNALPSPKNNVLEQSTHPRIAYSLIVEECLLEDQEVRERQQHVHYLLSHLIFAWSVVVFRQCFEGGGREEGGRERRMERGGGGGREDSHQCIQELFHQKTWQFGSQWFVQICFYLLSLKTIEAGMGTINFEKMKLTYCWKMSVYMNLFSSVSSKWWKCFSMKSCFILVNFSSVCVCVCVCVCVFRMKFPTNASYQVKYPGCSL